MEILSTTINEATKVLGIGRTKIYELIKSGELETVKIGRRRLIKAASMRKLINGGG